MVGFLIEYLWHLKIAITALSRSSDPELWRSVSIFLRDGILCAYREQVANLLRNIV